MKATTRTIVGVSSDDFREQRNNRGLDTFPSRFASQRSGSPLSAPLLISVQQLEAACRRALVYESPEYASVKSILTKGLDRLDDDDEPVLPSGQRLFAFAREPGYFDPDLTSFTKGDTHERIDDAQAAPRAPETIGHA
jgi:hypothetical protein